MAASSKIYQQNSTDTPLSWLALQDYLGMEKPRTLEALHKRYISTERKSPTTSLSTLRNWHFKHNWKDRSAAYDKDQADLTLDKIAKQQQHEDIERVIDFTKTVARSGQAGVNLAGTLKEAINAFLANDFRVETLEEAYKASRIIQAIEPSSMEMLAQSIGVTKLLESVEVNSQ